MYLVANFIDQVEIQNELSKILNIDQDIKTPISNKLGLELCMRLNPIDTTWSLAKTLLDRLPY